MICSINARSNPTESSRYRNVRPGDCLKELNLTEGRATGIPTIQDELRANGSPMASIETDEERSFFLIDLPCRADMVEHMAIDKIIRYNDSFGAVDFTKDFTKDFIKENKDELTERQKDILLILAEDNTLSSPKISLKISLKKPVSSRTIKQIYLFFRKKGLFVMKAAVKTVTGNCFSCHWTNWASKCPKTKS